MKKALLVLVSLCLVFALSCESTGGSAPTAAAAAGPVPGGALGAMEFALNWNPPGSNFQAEIRNPNILKGYRLERGDVFTLKVTYTASRDVGEIGVGFSDMTPWTPLSWRQPRGSEIPLAAHGGATLPASKAGETVSAEVTITLHSRASGSGDRANTMIFATLGAQTLGAVTLRFTEFTLTKN